MRCNSCDCNLTNYETSLKDVFTGQYVDMCYTCCKLAGLNVVGNPIYENDVNLDDGDDNE